MGATASTVGRTDGRCTGPRTPEGKAKSSMNALKHGLAAKTPLIPGEDAAEFQRFVSDLVEDLQPEGPVQAELAQRVAVLMWKRRRIEEAERQVIKELAENYVTTEGDGEEGEAVDPAADAEQEIPVDPADPLRLLRFMIADEFASTKPKQRPQLELLARYDQRLSQQIDSTIRLLLKLQNRKQWQEQQERKEQREEDRPREENLPVEHPAPHAAQQSGALAPPPRTAAQNELPPRPPAAAQNRPAGGWRGPPGAN